MLFCWRGCTTGRTRDVALDTGGWKGVECQGDGENVVTKFSAHDMSFGTPPLPDLGAGGCPIDFEQLRRDRKGGELSMHAHLIGPARDPPRGRGDSRPSEGGPGGGGGAHPTCY